MGVAHSLFLSLSDSLSLFPIHPSSQYDHLRRMCANEMETSRRANQARSIGVSHVERQQEAVSAYFGVQSPGINHCGRGGMGNGDGVCGMGGAMGFRAAQARMQVWSGRRRRGGGGGEGEVQCWNGEISVWGGLSFSLSVCQSVCLSVNLFVSDTLPSTHTKHCRT